MRVKWEKAECVSPADEVTDDELAVMRRAAKEVTQLQRELRRLKQGRETSSRGRQPLTLH